MKNKDDSFKRFRSIPELHRAFGLPKPRHPLINLSHFNESNLFNLNNAVAYEVLDFYKITFITQNSGRLTLTFMKVTC